jgi:2,4-dienoyl-CoA reductase-like NADH-dependent reductase (Old Yellow Enzyme family)
MLFEPTFINKMELKNRIVRSATYENMCTEDGEVTDAAVSLYGRLAKGGTGLIIPGHAFVHRSGQAGPNQIGVYSDNCISGLARLADEVHKHSAKIALQLAHAGRQTSAALIGDTPIAPSPVADPRNNTVPREMSTDDIDTIIEAFARAAGRAKEAGCDAVQLHAAHGYLLAQFISPHTNHRSDEWGGSLEKNLRFASEIYKKVREAVGADFPVLMKLNVEEYLPDGITADISVGAAKHFAALGVDSIEISGGVISENPFVMCQGEIPIDMLTAGKDPDTKAQMEKMFYSRVGDVKLEEAYWLPYAEKIKPVIGSTPLMLVGGMKYPQTMEKILQDGHADCISMCRPLIKEPNFPNEMAEGRKSPAKCSFCNRCLMMARSAPLRCYN